MYYIIIYIYILHYYIYIYIYIYIHIYTYYVYIYIYIYIYIHMNPRNGAAVQGDDRAARRRRQRGEPLRLHRSGCLT